MCIYSEFISWRRVVYRGCQNSPWRIGPSLCISLIAKKHAFGQCFGKQKAEPFKRCGDQELYKSNRKQCKKFTNHMRARVRKPGTMKGLKRDALMSIMICMVEDRKLLRNRLMKLSVMQTKKKHIWAVLFMFHMATIGAHAAPSFVISHLKHAKPLIPINEATVSTSVCSEIASVLPSRPMLWLCDFLSDWLHAIGRHEGNKVCLNPCAPSHGNHSSIAIVCNYDAACLSSKHVAVRLEVYRMFTTQTTPNHRNIFKQLHQISAKVHLHKWHSAMFQKLQILKQFWPCPQRCIDMEPELDTKFIQTGRFRYCFILGISRFRFNLRDNLMRFASNDLQCL